MTTPTEDLKDVERMPEAVVLRCDCCGGGLAYVVAHLLRTVPLLHLFRAGPLQQIATVLIEETGLIWEAGTLDRLWEIDVCHCGEENAHVA